MICESCKKIPRNDALRKKVIRRQQSVLKNPKYKKIKTMSSKEKNQRIRSLKKRDKLLNRKFLRLKVRLERVKKKISIIDVGSEAANRGDLKNLSMVMKKAYDGGLLETKDRTFKFIKNLLGNLTKKDRGKRYTNFTKSLYEMTMIWGGTRLVNFLAANLDGPDAHSVRRMMRRTRIKSTIGFQTDFEDLKVMYSRLMATHDIKNVLVEQAEDETGIMKYFTYDQRQDLIVGSCGPKANHVCQESFTYKVGDSYEGLVAFFQEHVLASYGRVIMFNPLHIHLPPTVIFLGCTCNSFDNEYVEKQWRKCQQIFADEFYPVFKGPLIGQSSDGDARRRKCMVRNGGKKDGERFKIDSDNFTISGEVERDANDNVVSLNIPNQDYIHNGKKATYPLDHASRKLAVGKHMAHMNHLAMVRNHFDFEEHGLRIEDVERKDRQNWASAQRLLFPRVQNCLKKLESGKSQTGRKEDVLGTRMYLQIFYMYVEIFCSLSLSLYERVQYASIVTNFLRIWRSWVYHSASYSLKENFITMQCYTDVIISCHAAVLHIRAGRMFTPSEAIVLSKTGSDCCEDYFSSNGSFVMNRHTYRFGDMVEVLPKMNRINEIRADPDAPTVPKGHKKQINIWGEGNITSTEKPDLRNYPTDEQMVEAWNSGITRAQKLCCEVGIAPPNTITTAEQRMKYFWFFTPHQLSVQLKKTMEESMCDGNEDGFDKNGPDVEVEEEAAQSEATDDDEEEDDMGDTDIAIQNIHRLMEDEGEVIDEDCDQQEPPQPLPHTIPKTHSLKITIPGGKDVHKSTLVALLNNNSDGKISKDRLTRVASVKKTNADDNSTVTIDYRKDLSLNGDVAVINKSHGFTYSLGRIQRMVKSGKSRGKIEYKKTVNLNDEKEQDITIMIIPYTSQDGDTNFRYEVGKSKNVHIQDVIMGVRLYVNDNEQYTLDQDDSSSLESIMEEHRSIADSRRIRKKRNVQVEENRAMMMAYYGSADGDEVIRSVVVPSEHTGHERRSKRTRTVIVRDTYQ